MPTLVATADPATGSILINIDQTIIFDSFTRAVAGGWGNATETGQPWTVAGGAAGDYSVAGSGFVSQTSVNVSRYTFINSGSVDHDAWGQVTIPVVPTGAPLTETVIVRSPGGVDGIYSNISVATTGVVTLTMTYLFGGSTGTLGSIVLADTHVAAATWFIRASACGDQIRAKAWRSTVAEPDWLITVTPSLPNTGTIVGTRSRLDSGNTNVLPVQVAWDNFRTNVGAPVRLFRVIDGVSTEVRGSPFYTEPVGADAIFWDNEAPFDVDISYTLTGNCSSTVQGTSNVVNLDSDGGGWLRSPTNPSLNIRVELDGFFDECDPEDRIVFSGLGDPVYANASGVFDLINSPRPQTIAQIRRNYASSLTLTSFSLNDVLDLEDLFAPGNVIQLSLPLSENYGWALRTYGTDYITVGDVQQAYIGIDQGLVCRTWTLPFRLALPPRDTSELGVGGNGIGGGDATYDALAASALGTTYNSLTASGNTYIQIASGGGY